MNAVRLLWAAFIVPAWACGQPGAVAQVDAAAWVDATARDVEVDEGVAADALPASEAAVVDDARDDTSNDAEEDAPSVPVDAGAGVVLLVANQQNPSFIAVDRTSLYWTTFDLGRTFVMKLPLAGGIPVTLAIGPGAPFGLGVDGTHVYWTQSAIGGSGSVMSVPIDGGPSVPLAKGRAQPTGLAIDSTSVYWSEEEDGGFVMRASLDGAAPSVVASGQIAPSAVAVDVASVYWSSQYVDQDSGQSFPSIMRAPLDGGAPILVEALGDRLASFAVNGTAVYSSDSNCAVQGTAIDGASSACLADASTWSCPLFMGRGGIVADGTRVYWAVQNSSGPTNPPTGMVMSSPIDSGPDASDALITIAVAQRTPVGVAVDATHVYWTSSGIDTPSGQVMMAPK